MEKVLGTLDRCQELESDGLSYLISGLLRKADILHTVMGGYIKDLATGKVVKPHLWIELSTSLLIDYRAQVRLGTHEYVPHGIFHPRQRSVVKYEGMKAAIQDHENRAMILAAVAGVDFDDLVHRLSEERKQQHGQPHLPGAPGHPQRNATFNTQSR